MSRRAVAGAALGAFLVLMAASARMLLPQTVDAQAPAFAWQPVDPADLALKDNPASRGSHAMILNFEAVVDDPHRFESISARIKVFDEEGKNYGNVEIPYEEKNTQVEDIQARTVQPDGSIANFQGQVFDQYVVKFKKLKYRAKVFTLPDVQAGSIIEYSYRIYWHKDVPDIIRDPSKFVVPYGNVYSMRTASWNVQQDLFVRRGHFVFRPYPKAHLLWTGRALWATKERPEVKADGTYEMEVRNYPAFQQEDYMPPEPLLRGRVDFLYLVGSVGSDESFWSQYGSERAKNLEEYLGKHKKVDRVAAETVAPNDPPEVKLRKLYARAQKIRFLSYEHFRTEKEVEQEHLSENKNVDDILEHGYARANEINYLFTALARAAGFDAKIVLLTSRQSNQFTLSLFDPSQLTAMVVWVLVGDRDVYLDPATNFCPYGLLPWEETGTGGVRISKNGSGIARTPAPRSEEAVLERKATLRIDSDGILQGKLEVMYRGQYALSLRGEMHNEDATGRGKRLREEAKDWLPPGATVELSNASGWEGAEEPLRAEFTVSIPNQIVKTPRRILLPLAVTAEGESNPLPHAARVHPVYFRFPYEKRDEITLELPAGYEVEALPKPRKQIGRSTSYELSSVQEGKNVVVKRRVVMDAIYYKTELYPGLRLFFNEVKTGDQDRAVLKLVQAPTPR